MLTVHGRKTSVNVQKVMWAVAELGLEHTRTDVGGPFGGLDSPEYGALNPNRLVPVLDDNGFRLWESNAIVRYLADSYGRGGLAPEGRYAFARCDQWAEWVAAAAERAGAKLQLLDAQIGSNQFIAGDALTIADIGVGSLMYRYMNLAIKRPRLPNVEGWYQRLSHRKAYQEHVMVDFAAMKVPGA